MLVFSGITCLPIFVRIGRVHQKVTWVDTHLYSACMVFLSHQLLSLSLSLREHLVLISIQERKWIEIHFTSNSRSGTLVREIVPHWQNHNCLTVTKIWSWASDGAWHQDWLAECPLVIMWLWLWVVASEWVSGGSGRESSLCGGGFECLHCSSTCSSR
jgi:hypothetical protein